MGATVADHYWVGFESGRALDNARSDPSEKQHRHAEQFDIIKSGLAAGQSARTDP